MALNVLDQLSVGIVLLDRQARVIFANAAARSLAGEGGPLRLNGGVTSLFAPEGRRLDDLIRSALDGTAVRAMSLPSAAGRSPLMVVVSPVSDTGTEHADIRELRRAAAMVMLCDPDRSAQVPAVWIMDAYGLTLAEGRVAIALSSGSTVAETARRLAVSPNTIKTHLRRVFEKTGTTRQAELSRLMATIGFARSGG